jgi:DNA-binding NtrC family response regulator
MAESVSLGITDDLLFGRSEGMQHLRRQVDDIARTGLPVLIEGESGTGKDVLARAIHERSSRRSRGLIKIVCSDTTAIPSLDDVMFGTGWLIEGANGADRSEMQPAGTVVFDNIGELDSGLQRQLAHLLQDARFTGHGESCIQVLCTTKSDLGAKLAAGSLRDDLYYRLNVIHLLLPPLRERRIDIPALAFHFFKLYAEKYHCYPAPLSQRVLGLLVSADWPGNIRELENAIKRYVALGSAESLIADLRRTTPATLPDQKSGDLSLKALTRNAVRDCEYKAILTSLTQNQWNRRQTARDLHVSYRSLLYRMKQLDFPKKRSMPGGRLEPSSEQ